MHGDKIFLFLNLFEVVKLFELYRISLNESLIYQKSIELDQVKSFSIIFALFLFEGLGILLHLYRFVVFLLCQVFYHNLQLLVLYLQILFFFSDFGIFCVKFMYFIL